MKLTDYPGFKEGDVYIIAMAGGEAEEAQSPISAHVFNDKRNALDRASTQEEWEEIRAIPCDWWVDSLYVLRDGEEIATWTRKNGWREETS